ncbi:MAG: hypothetical protein LCI00_31860 [Chloroflexi bacterium]|nr:hypothetical protein [Chloroflexota bacterium]MCC6894398.1 hypothetical protein [Anaerolineae bacterium]
MSHQTLIMRVFLLIAAVCLAAATPPSPTPVSLEVAVQRPMQSLYQIEEQASANGWTAELAKTAGDIWEGVGDFSRAVAYWELAAKLQPDGVVLTRRLAQAYLELERWSQSVIALSRVVEQSDDNWAHFQLGILQSVYDSHAAAEHLNLAARDPLYQGVVTALLPAVEERSDLVRAMRIGTTLATYTYWPAAEYVFQYGASMTPVFPEALAYVGIARDQQGKDGSVQIAQAVALAPKTAQVRYLEGIHFQLTQNSDASLQSLLLAATLDPLNPAYAAELGTTYDRMGIAVSAEYWYKAAVTVSNNDPRFEDLLNAFYQQPSVNIITATPVVTLTPAALTPSASPTPTLTPEAPTTVSP